MGCATSQPEVKDDRAAKQHRQRPPPQSIPASQPAAATVPTAPASVPSIGPAEAQEPNPTTQPPPPAAAVAAAANLPGSSADPTVPGPEPAMNGNGTGENDEGALSIEALLAEPEVAPTKRATRRSTDSVMVENIDVFNYTSLTSKSMTNTRNQAPNLRFEVDGIRTAYDVGKSTSMDTLLKASRRAATYHGAGAGGQGPLSVEELNECRRSYLEKIQMPLLVEEPSKEGGTALYQFDATHEALKGLDWNTYFKQEGDNPPAPQSVTAPVMAVVDSEGGSGGVLSIEQLLADPSASSDEARRSSGRRASAVM
eukprot:CAMPEP_0117662960 /NCGR_PEP_ID=MMETSP0804-20121206/8329_1 /TAXON_ID=1074897 /ORGANISM="Tetraselmis astigmatica, Strain CCMP880" /LENGTH=311 /DNA_ID=CAMNT_0005469889 /DNA_START=473 /DNA_END=1409 /DNA_ORIENTATION=-